jgi:hypothetical protein
MIPMGLGTKNHFAGEGQQPFNNHLGTELPRCNKLGAYTEKPTPPLVEEEAPHQKHVHI